MPPIDDAKIEDWKPLDFGMARDRARRLGAELDDNFAILCFAVVYCGHDFVCYSVAAPA